MREYSLEHWAKWTLSNRSRKEKISDNTDDGMSLESCFLCEKDCCNRRINDEATQLLLVCDRDDEEDEDEEDDENEEDEEEDDEDDDDVDDDDADKNVLIRLDMVLVKRKR